VHSERQHNGAAKTASATSWRGAFFNGGRLARASSTALAETAKLVELPDDEP